MKNRLRKRIKSFNLSELMEYLDNCCDKCCNEICTDLLKHDEEGRIKLHTDGCCLNNGKSNAQAGIGVCFNKDHPWNLAERVVGKQSSNTAEIDAGTRGLEILKEAGCQFVHLYTDSKLLYHAIKEYLPKWKRNGWKRSNGDYLKNEDSWKDLDRVLKGMDVVCTHVGGHRGDWGNEEAHRLANEGALMDFPN